MYKTPVYETENPLCYGLFVLNDQQDNNSNV